MDKASHKKINTILKKTLIEANMSESELQAVRQTISELNQIGKQGVMYVTPLSIGKASGVSIVEASIEKIIPYVGVSADQPSEPK